MKFEYLAQDEYDSLDKINHDDGKNYKDPVEIVIRITVEKTRYKSVKNRRTTPLPQYILEWFDKLFKPSK